MASTNGPTFPLNGSFSYYHNLSVGLQLVDLFLEVDDVECEFLDLLHQHFVHLAQVGTFRRQAGEEKERYWMSSFLVVGPAGVVSLTR